MSTLKFQVNFLLPIVSVLLSCSQKPLSPSPDKFLNSNDCFFLNLIGEECISNHYDSSFYLIFTLKTPSFVDSSMIISIKEKNGIIIGTIRKFGYGSHQYLHNDSNLFWNYFNHYQKIEYSTKQLFLTDSFLVKLTETMQEENLFNLPSSDSLSSQVLDGIIISFDLSFNKSNYTVYRLAEENMVLKKLVVQLLDEFSQERLKHVIFGELN